MFEKEKVRTVCVLVVHLSAAIPGVHHGTYAGIARDLLTFVANLLTFVARGIGPLLHFRGKICGERAAGFVT